MYALLILPCLDALLLVDALMHALPCPFICPACPHALQGEDEAFPIPKKNGLLA
jgi:hypothetical protein